MSVRLIANVLDNVHGLPHGAKLLLLCLADYADDKGRCWPSFQSVAERSDMSRRHVIRTVQELETLGFLSRAEERPYKPTVYQLHIPTSDTHVTRSSDAHVTSDTDDTSDTHVTTLVTPTSLGSDAHVTSTSDIAMSPNPSIRTTKEPSKEPSERDRSKRSRALPDEFRVTDGMRVWAQGKGFGDEQIDSATEKFETYWRANGKAKSNWEQAWRNWLLNERDRYGPRPANTNGHAPPKTAAYHRDMAKLQTIIERGDTSEPIRDGQNRGHTPGLVAQN